MCHSEECELNLEESSNIKLQFWKGSHKNRGE